MAAAGQGALLWNRFDVPGPNELDKAMGGSSGAWDRDRRKRAPLSRSFRWSRAEGFGTWPGGCEAAHLPETPGHP